MNAVATLGSRLSLISIILSFSLISVSCGAGGYSPPAQPSPQPSPNPNPALQSMQGSWTISFHSDVFNDYTVLEANISQAGTHVFAGATSSLVYQGTTLATTIPPTTLGSKCDSGATGTVILDGTISNQQTTSEALAFTLTQTGALGSSVISASSSTNGAQILDGTYTIPAACGFPDDHGTFQGFRDSVKFSGVETYTGTFRGDTILVNFKSDPNGFGLSAAGTDNTAAFNLTGSSTGFFLTLTGNISSQPVTWLVLFDSTYYEFTIYDSNAKLLGTLSGSKPWDY